MSRRRSFKNILPDRKILDHLDYLGLGYGSKTSRKIVSTKYDEFGMTLATKRSVQMKTKGPFPFNWGPRKIMGPISVHLWKNAPMLGECPEVAIIGRSNAGKSTLVNSLLGYDSSYTKRAPVSSKPGETQALQFYVLRKQYKSKQPALGIVDMPGYGFSFTSEKEAQRCFTLNSSYIRLRGKNLKRVLLVVDARHGLKRTDFRCLHDLMSNTFRDAGDITTDPSADFDVKFDHSKKSANDATWKLQIILTKCDLVERLDLARRIAAVRDQVRANFFEDDLPVMMVSAAKGLGIVELQKELSSLVILDRVEKME